MLETSVNQNMQPNQNAQIDEKLNEMVSVSVQIPRGALDLLAFRYYKLNIIENDVEIVQTAIKELVSNQLATEYSAWFARSKVIQEEKNIDRNLEF